MKDLPASSLKKGYVSLGPVCNDMEEQGDDIDLSDICEVVISLKCKKCDFLCNDKSTLAQHIKQFHIQNSKASSNGNSIKIISSSNGNQIQIESQSEGKTNSKGSFATEPERNDRKVKAQTSSSTYKQHVEKYSKQNKSNSKNSPVVTVDNVQEGEDNAGDESVEDVFLCAECDIVFSSRETCCSHMHKVHGLKQFSADFIQEEIISKPSEEAKSAKKRKTQMPRKFTQDAGTVVPKKYRVTKDIFHSCTKCTIKFESVEVMKFHEKCHLTATSKHEGEELTNNIVMPKGFLCPVCESNGNGNGEGQQLFPKWGPCSWHMWKEHRIDCELYTCSVCKQFKSHLSARVKDHEQLHSSKASYKCKTCNKTFKQLKQLRCHEKYHKDHSTKLAPVVDSRWYTPKECPICKRILSDSKCLKKHISAVHNKLKPYVCNICGHTSARKQELLLHKRQHTGEKPYSCPMCFFETGDHNSLRKHKLRHCDKRPYSCTYCDYRCIQSCAFKKHTLASHPGQEVVFLCQLCSHKSVNETHFAAHKKDHMEGRIATKTDNVENGATEPTAKTSASSNNDHRTSKATVHSWSGDDDSLDIIDNGGMTIPATPPPPKFSTDTKVISVPKANQANQNPIKAKKKKVKKQVSTSARSSSSPNESALPSTSISTSSSVPNPNNTVYSNKLTEILDSTTKPIIIVSGATGDNVNPIQVHSQPTTPSPSPQIFCPTAPLPSPSLPSPRYVTVSSSSSNGFATATVNSDGIQQDPESSTSEVITNPHQLIQNIQLTPLDLTDIINCNEQSNDDGMLQRLLDMSGV